MDTAPHWEPLERAVGLALAVTFMWMFEARTADGRRVQAYKHRATRRYVHLDDAGLAYACRRDRYVQVPLADALEEALRPWWEELDATPDEIADAHDAIARARRAAATEAAA